jgi:lipopolysaccharide transport system permease protein
MSTSFMMVKEVSSRDIPRVRIRADERVRLIDIPELLRYRDLLLTLAERDIRVRYKQTALGVIWVILQPLMASLIFTFVFVVIARMPSRPGLPYILIAFAGMTAWNVFSGVLGKVSGSLLANAGMLSKIYFPRMILPLSTTISSLFDSAFTLAMMGLLMVCYRVQPGWGIVLLPVWLAVLVVLALSLGLIAGSLVVRYRDIGHIVPVALQMGLFISPVAWQMSNIHNASYRWILWLNPLSSLVEAVRWSLLGDGNLPPAPALAYAVVVAAAFFWLGAAVFKQQERSFADVI